MIVRGKRPGSVQTTKQVIFVNNFETHLRSLKVIFHHAVDKVNRALLNIGPIKFTQVISNQRKLLQNSELQRLRYIPKVIKKKILSRFCMSVYRKLFNSRPPKKTAGLKHTTLF